MRNVTLAIYDHTIDQTKAQSQHTYTPVTSALLVSILLSLECGTSDDIGPATAKLDKGTPEVNIYFRNLFVISTTHEEYNVDVQHNHIQHKRFVLTKQ